MHGLIEDIGIVIKSLNDKFELATLIATADLPEQVRELKHAGANEVILPYSMAGEYLATYLGTVIVDQLELAEPLPHNASLV